MVTNNWYYYNDANVTKQEPVPSDDRAYILFYDKVNCNNEDMVIRRSCLMDTTTHQTNDMEKSIIEGIDLLDPPLKSNNGQVEDTLVVD